MTEELTELRSLYAWPIAPPMVDRYVHGWGLHAAQFDAIMPTDREIVVVEVGTWLGKNAAHLLTRYSNIHLICIDKWDWVYEPLRDQLKPEQVYPIVQRNLWEYRHRCTLLPLPSTTGLSLLYQLGIRPDLIYIDGDHAYGAVKSDLRIAIGNFSDAIICGDDYEDVEPPVNGVKQAVHEWSNVRDLHRDGRFWWFSG